MRLNKRGIIRAGTIFFIVVALFLTILLSFSSSASTQETYELNEKVKIDLERFENPILKVTTPSETLIIKPEKNFFVLELNEIGNYIVDIKGNIYVDRFEYEVLEKTIVQEIIQEITSENKILEEPLEVEETDIKEKNSSINKSNLIKIGEPVKNEEVISTNPGETLKLKIPESATEVNVEGENKEQVNFKVKESFTDTISNIIHEEDEKSLIIKQPIQEELILEYTTPGPEKQEQEISNTKKQVVVSSEPGIHYKGVLGFTEVEEFFTLEEKDKIEIFWEQESRYLDFEAYDTNNNGLIDYIEWFIPHLSTQTFQIIFIVDAYHLDENKNFIQDVYEEVKSLDNIWFSVPSGDYLRVGFEKELINGNDISLQASGQGIIEIYAYESTEKLGEINVDGDNFYRHYLQGLSSEESLFELRFIGYIKVDYIVDPTTTSSPSAFTDVSTQWSSETNAYADGGGTASSTQTGQIIYYNYSFGYTSDYTINSVRVRTDYGIGDADDYFQMHVSWDGGTTWSSTAHILPNNALETTVWTNVTSDTSWTYDKLNNTNFRVRYSPVKSKGPSTWYLDWVPVEVIYSYTPPAGELAVSLNYPEDNGGQNNATVPFNFTPISDYDFTNCSLWDNSTGSWHLNKSNTTSIINNSINTLNKAFSSDGYYEWNVQCCDGVDCSFAVSNRTFTLDTQDPVVYQVYPFDNHYSNSTYGVDFVYNVTDTNNIENCSLLINGSAVATDTTITKGTNQTISYPVESGVHNWGIQCFDVGGNSYTTNNLSVNISFSPQTLYRRWYETSSEDNFTSTADIYLDNTRDSVENNISVSVSAASLYTLVEAYSPFMANNGAIIPGGTISFSAVATSSSNNKGFLTWKLYVSDASGDSLICQAGDDRATGGTRITSGSGPWTDTCLNSGDLYLDSTDRLKLVLNVWNSDSGSLLVNHFWDNLRLSYVELPNLTSLGNIETNLTWPLTDQVLDTGNQINVTCEAICDAGQCIDTVVYIQQNTSVASWTDIGSSGNLILAGIETNPHDLGNVSTNATYTNFTIQANQAAVTNIRCYAVSDYSSYISPVTRKLTISSANLAPNVTLYFPSNGNWSNFTNIQLQYNVSDDTNQLTNCSLFVNGIYNQSNSTNVINNVFNNFTIYGLNNGEYNWTVNCTDAYGLSEKPTNFTFWVDTNYPQFDLLYPGIDEIVSKSRVDFNFTVYDYTDSLLDCNLTIDGQVENESFIAQNATLTNVTIVGVSIGDHLWNISCLDNAGNYNFSETRNFTVQDLAPNVTLNYPTPNLWLNTNSFNISYNVSDNNIITNCSLYINGAYNQSNSTQIIQNVLNNFTVSNWGEGNYNWTVNCTDDYGLSTQPNNWSFWIDTIFPTIDLNLPGHWTNYSFSDVNFNFTGDDNLDNELTCDLTINGQIVDPSFSATSGLITNRPINSLTDGLKYWNVTCIDEAGNSNTSETRILNISEYPQLILDTSDNEFFNESTINLSYTVSDNTGLSMCQLYINGIYNQSNSTPINNGGQNNFTLIPSAGTYNWSVLCNDTIGLVNETSNRTFTIDLQYPKINLTYPDNDATLYSSTITFNYSVIDDVANNLLCNLTVDGIQENSTYAINNSITSAQVTFISGGLKYWNVTCMDSAKNINTSETRNFTLYLPPNVTLYTPENYQWLNTSNMVLFYNVSDGNDDIVNATLFLNGTLNQTNQTNIVNNELNNFSLYGLDDGIYNWTVQVGDGEGLVGTDSLRFFYIDTQKPNITIDFPSQGETITKNNFSLNFTLEDNLATNFTCNLSFDEYNEFQNQVFYPGQNMRYLPAIRSDGNYSWYVECFDFAGNYNVSETTNFTILAPPNVTLQSPGPDYRTVDSDVTFRYVPYEDQDLVQCRFYLDGAVNDTETTIFKNDNNTFNILGITEGVHNWTVDCQDPDGNWDMAPNRTFYRDINPPNVSLGNPGNDSKIDINDGTVTFSWTPTDDWGLIMRCNLTVDGQVEDENALVSSGFEDSEPLTTAYLGQGTHYWNVTCWDDLNNTNTSETRVFYIDYPDFSINSSGIYFNETNPKENSSVEINATIFNLGSADSINVNVSFFDGNPGSGGTMIDYDLININAGEQVNASIIWNPDMGTSEIYVFVDYEDSFSEANESNNNASKNSTVESWHYFYGNISASSIFKLADQGNESVLKWTIDNFESGNVYAADYGSSISWSDLIAIGKTTLGGDSSSDFSEIDAVIGSTNYGDSVYETYTNSGTIKEKESFNAFKRTITEVPVMNSTNNTNFKTGILWDSSDDLDNDNEYDSTDKEEIVFVSKLNKDSQGAYGEYDYEIRIPARLRNYDGSDSYSAEFYVEIR